MSQQSQPLPPPPAPTPVLAYSGPNYAQAATGGAWRDNELVVLHRSCALPDACFKCGSAPQPKRLKLNVTTIHPLSYLGLLGGVLPFAIIAMCTQKKAVVMLPLCDRHRAKRLHAILICLGLVLGAFPVWFLAAVQSSGLLGILGGVMFLGGAIYGVVAIAPSKAKKIDDQYVWLKGSGEHFRNSLPDMQSAVIQAQQAMQAQHAQYVAETQNIPPAPHKY